MWQIAKLLKERIKKKRSRYILVIRSRFRGDISPSLILITKQKKERTGIRFLHFEEVLTQVDNYQFLARMILWFLARD